MAGDTSVLAVDGLVKSFGALRAVDGVSFSLDRGQILGLLGPNGAGKTTTVSMICSLLQPDAGHVRVLGRPIAGDTDPLKQSIGLVPQDLALYEELSAHDNLRFFGALYALSGRGLEQAVGDALAFVGLSERAGDKVKTFSGGMKRRLNLAAGLLHDPQILLMDEPTVGVDPQSRNAIFENIQALQARGKAVLYTTHYMEEAERLCARVVIVDHGRVIADDSPRALAQRLPASCRLTVEVEEAPEGPWVVDLGSLAGVESAELDDGRLSVALKDLGAGAPAVLAFLAEAGVIYSHVTSERADLEAVFLALTGRGLRDS